MSAISEQAAVTDWPLRLLLTTLTAVVIALILLALRRGWRNRAARQPELALPAASATTVLAGPVTGKYVGTVTEGDWLDRVVAGGAMARCEVSRTSAGLHLDRQGEQPLLIPVGQVRAAGTAPGMLQKVFGRHGVLTVTWDWDGTRVVSGIWFPAAADQKAVLGWLADMTASGVKENTA